MGVVGNRIKVKVGNEEQEREIIQALHIALLDNNVIQMDGEGQALADSYLLARRAAEWLDRKMTVEQVADAVVAKLQAALITEANQSPLIQDGASAIARGPVNLSAIRGMRP